MSTDMFARRQRLGWDTWVYDDAGLIVTRKAAPESEGIDRARWQFTTPLPDGHVTLDRVQTTGLCLALAHALGGTGFIVDPMVPRTVESDLLEDR